MRDPDMVLHDGMTRIFGPVLTEQEFAEMDEELANGIIEFWIAQNEVDDVDDVVNKREK